VKAHIKNYLDHFGLIPGDFIACERCSAPCNDFHHIVYRSHFGKKEQEKCDSVENIIALCRDCHNKAHAEKISKEKLQEIHNKNLKNGG